MNFASPAAIFVSSFIIALSGALMPGPLLAVTVRDTSRQGFVAAPLLVLGHGILEAGLLALILLGLAEWVRGDVAATVRPKIPTLTRDVVVVAVMAARAARAVAAEMVEMCSFIFTAKPMQDL